MRVFRIQPRLTPVLIFCASLLLTVKVAGVWQGVVVVTGVDRANAQSAPPPQPPAPPAEPASAKAPADKSAAMAGQGPAPPSGADLEVLQSLALRRDQLDQRAGELDMREKLLMAAEERIKGRVDDLKKIEDSIKSMIVQQDAKKAEEMAKLVRVYETMKPKEAAAIFDSLDQPVLISVVSMMQTGKLAPVLAAMTPEKAKQLTVELATRKTVPESAPDGMSAMPATAMSGKAPGTQSGAAPTATARPPGLLQPLPPGSRQGNSG